MVLADCGETQEEEEHFAFLSPDNQTGDAGVDWARGIVNRGLAAAVGFSVASDTVADARLASERYNRLVYSTLTAGEGGEVRFHSAIFDATDQHFYREYTVSGNILQVINRMAVSINPEPNSLGAKSEEALRKWPVLAGSDIATYETKCLELAEAEPAFGAALGSCAEQLTAAGRAEALRGLLSRVQPEQSKAFSPDVLETIGNSFMALKQYSDAAVMFRAGANAGRTTMKNMVGYSEALSGRYEAGKQALEEYSRVPGHEQNALDSLGEISFFSGKYREAEQYFTASEGKMLVNRRVEIEPLKVAASRLMSGDVAGANKLANEQFDKLAKGDPPNVARLKPLWTSIVNAGSPEDRKRIIEGSLIRRP